MSLYQEYADNANFRAFRKLVRETIQRHFSQHTEQEDYALAITRYLEVSVVPAEAIASTECMVFYPLRDLYRKGDFLPDRVEMIAVKYVVEPSQQPDTKYDVLNASMKEAYQQGAFPEMLTPYFDWKLGNISCTDLTLEQCIAMSEKVSDMLDEFDAKHPEAHTIHDNFIVDDPWQLTRGYGEDKCMVAYLQYIEGQLEDLRMRLS